MPNYNISVVIDPSGAAAGASVVESNLGRLQPKAKALETSLQRAFDFNTGPAVAATSAVDRAIDGVKSSADQMATSVDSAMNKAATSAVRNNQKIVNSAGQVRQSQLSLGQQFNDFSTQVLAGGSVVTAFAQQSGQAAFALQGMNGVLGTVGRFLAGPWGTILIIATTVLAGLVTQMLAKNNALDESVKKLREDAQEADVNRRAHTIFAQSADGVRESVRKMNEELGRSITTQREQEQATLAAARANLVATIATRQRLQAELEFRRDMLRAQVGRAQGPGERGDLAALGISRRQGDVAGAESALTQNAKDIADAQQALRNAQVPLALRDATELSTATGRINRQYDILRDRAVAAARGSNVLTAALGRTTLAIETQRQAALKAQQEAETASRRGDGVSRFTSRAQAVGIAGRELQRGGLRVSENEQFGGITPGAHVSSHKNAIDVNSGTGVTEANIPDLRARFDELARRYQARGYRVLWNGQVYEAGGSGPTGPIRGADKHRDHLHVEAPQSIVGKAQDSSNESQAISEYRQQVQIQEAKNDFVTGAVDQAKARGNSNVADTAAAQIARVFADYRRRFNEELAEGDKTRVAGAINDAVARETAAHFDEAYVKPLERLQALQGKTGDDRDILNKQLEETARLGRELTPVERQQIDNSVRQGNALSRQAEILAQIRQPQQDYADRIAALNALLAAGTINQTSYNARVADLGQSARDALSDLPGSDPNTGQTYGDIAARSGEDARYAKELESFQNNRAQLLSMGINYDALTEAAHKRHVDNLNQIDRDRRSVALLAASETFDSLASIARDSMGEQSAVYKAMFTVSKAFAIADSIIKIQQGIANALSLPFPANIGAAAAVAAQAASIISNIQAVAANFADGGFVTGPGSSRSDSVPANLSNGEFVVNASATRANRALLEAINSGRRPVVAANDTAPSSGGQTGDGITINVGDVIVQGGSGDGQAIGRNVKQAIVGIVREELGTQARSGGALTKTKTSVMSGG